jgi:hypothetical protein
MPPGIPDPGPGAALAAAPELTIDGPSAVITSVLFRWHIRCAWCHATSHLTSHGTVLAGLSISTSRKTCRWYQQDKPGPLPPLPGQCPECGQPRPYAGYPAREAAAISDCRSSTRHGPPCGPPTRPNQPKPTRRTGGSFGGPHGTDPDRWTEEDTVRPAGSSGDGRSLTSLSMSI